MDRLRAFWNRGWFGKAVLSIAGLVIVCCVIGILVPRRAPAPAAAQATSAPEVTALPAATDVPAPSRTPKPTQTLVPTFTPAPTAVTDRAGIDPVDGDCPALYRIKVSKNGIAHDLESGSYSRTTPVHCYATMKDATDHGNTAAAD